MPKGKALVVKKSDGGITLHFDTAFVVKSVRRPLPPPERIEKMKKGKGSYNRKEKHKKGYPQDDGGTF